jgi:hypothetical protein
MQSKAAGGIGGCCSQDNIASAGRQILSCFTKSQRWFDHCAEIDLQGAHVGMLSRQ